MAAQPQPILCDHSCRGFLFENTCTCSQPNQGFQRLSADDLETMARHNREMFSGECE